MYMGYIKVGNVMGCDELQPIKGEFKVIFFIRLECPQYKSDFNFSDTSL